MLGAICRTRVVHLNCVCWLTYPLSALATACATLRTGSNKQKELNRCDRHTRLSNTFNHAISRSKGGLRDLIQLIRIPRAWANVRRDSPRSSSRARSQDPLNRCYHAVERCSMARPFPEGSVPNRPRMRPARSSVVHPIFISPGMASLVSTYTQCAGRGLKIGVPKSRLFFFAIAFVVRLSERLCFARAGEARENVNAGHHRFRKAPRLSDRPRSCRSSTPVQGRPSILSRDEKFYTHHAVVVAEDCGLWAACADWRRSRRIRRGRTATRR